RPPCPIIRHPPHGLYGVPNNGRRHARPSGLPGRGAGRRFSRGGTQRQRLGLAIERGGETTGNTTGRAPAPSLHVVNHFRDRPAGTLRLNVPANVARTVLPPIITPFLKRYPEIRLEVTVE